MGVDRLEALLPDVAHLCRSALPDYWPELARLVERVLADAAPTTAILPLAACCAVGGDPVSALPVAAALVATELAVRLVDDVSDHDGRARWSGLEPPRARNLALAAQALALEILAQPRWPPALYVGVQQSFVDTWLVMTAARDRELAGAAATVEDYLQTIEMQAGAALATACGCGAMTGTDDAALIAACTRFGHHLGVAARVADELEAYRAPGLPDLARGRATLPVIYGLGREHAGRTELQSIVANGELTMRAGQARAILDGVDAGGFTASAAREARRQALVACAACPDADGSRALEACLARALGAVTESA